MTGKRARRMAGTAIGTLGLVVAMGGTGLASASTRSAASGTEHFQLMSVTGNSNGSPIIAHGAFTAAGKDKVTSSSTDRFVFPNGSFQVRHSHGTGYQHFNPKTCLASFGAHGTYRISAGTGAYAGISGHGLYRYTELAVGARNRKGACSMRKGPVAAQLIIRAAGPVHR